MYSVYPVCMGVDRPGYVIVFQVLSPMARMTKRIRIRNVANKPILYKVHYHSTHIAYVMHALKPYICCVCVKSHRFDYTFLDVHVTLLLLKCLTNRLLIKAERR